MGTVGTELAQSLRKTKSRSAVARATITCIFMLARRMLLLRKTLAHCYYILYQMRPCSNAASSPALAVTLPGALMLTLYAALVTIVMPCDVRTTMYDYL